MRYKVTFQFVNDLGKWTDDYLDNNGEGFDLEEASETATELAYLGCRFVKVEEKDVRNMS